jgi:hypothetical protein
MLQSRHEYFPGDARGNHQGASQRGGKKSSAYDAQEVRQRLFQKARLKRRLNIPSDSEADTLSRHPGSPIIRPKS